jgi:hypothetical protein
MSLVTVEPNDAQPLGIALSGEQIEAMYLAGHALLGRDPRRAADVFRLLALCEPLYADAWHALGSCHEELGELDVAATIYETGFLLGAKAPVLGLMAARAYWLAGEAEHTARLLETLDELELPEAVAAGARALSVLTRRAS